MLGSAEYARNMRATQSGVNDQSARRRRQPQISPEEAEARWEQAKRDHIIPFHKMALLTMAATAPAFIMVFMYTEPDVGWHWASLWQPGRGPTLSWQSPFEAAF